MLRGRKCILAIRTSKGHRAIKMDSPITVCEQRYLNVHTTSFKLKISILQEQTLNLFPELLNFMKIHNPN